MAKHEITLTTEQEAGVTHARGLANESRAEDEQLETNTDYVRFVMGTAADGYAKSVALAQAPEAVIAAKDAKIVQLEQEKAALAAQVDAKTAEIEAASEKAK